MRYLCAKDYKCVIIMARHNEFGKWGEDLAANYLEELQKTIKAVK